LTAVPRNHLVTGPPRSGKTTVVQAVRERLDLTPEGVDVQTGDRVDIASVDRDSGPGVGRYRVDVGAVDRLVARAFDAVGVDYWVIDEIAPMEVRSDRFVRGVRELLDDDVPVVGAVHYRSTDGFAAEARTRPDATVYDLSGRSVAGVVGDVVDAVGGGDTDDDGDGDD
jgi:nucleoside-triphosphatase